MVSLSRATDALAHTENGHDDDAEVEDVPRLLEVVPAQTQQLHDALAREDGDEDGVDEVEDYRQLLVLAVVLHRHRDHVEEDDDHNNDVELLVRRHLEEQQLAPELQPTGQLAFEVGIFFKFYPDNYSMFRFSRDRRSRTRHLQSFSAPTATVSLAVGVCLYEPSRLSIPPPPSQYSFRSERRI